MKIEVNETRAWIALIIFTISGLIGNLLDRFAPYPERPFWESNETLLYFLFQGFFVIIITISLTYLIIQIIFSLILRKRRKQRSQVNVG